MIEQELGTQSWMDSWSEETNSPSEDVSFYLAWLNRARRADVSLSFSFWSPPSLAGVLLHYIWFFLDYPGSTLVSHPCLYLSAHPISHFFWRSTSCGDPDSTVQGSCPHKWDQDVNCVYLMRRWQFILELLFHYSPMAVSLHLCFPLGCFGRLSLGTCRFFLPWSRFAKNRIVLGNVSWQFGPSSFVLGHFFLLSIGLGLDMKWAGVTRFFGPTTTFL